MGKRWIGILVLVAVIVGPAYFFLLQYSPAPAEPFPLDLADVRKAAASLPGSKATEIRYEDVLSLSFPEAAQVAGDPWRQAQMHIYAYQLVFPGATLIIDTAQDHASAKPDAMVTRYDDAAYLRVSRAMERATTIVVTHEHTDHMGGIVAHPHLRQILPAVKLTAEQFTNAGRIASSVALPAEAAKGYEPIAYRSLVAIAPGVVLIKAPGHTPGSQMVYVQRADGRELLFLGDVSWKMRNIELVRERPLLMTLIIGEDRRAVLGQFQTLHRLHEQEPALALVPGHEQSAIQALEGAGLLKAGFQ